MPFLKGHVANPYGRPKRPEIEMFREAIAQVEKRKGKSLLVHAVEKAYTDAMVLTALLKKILPDLTHDESLRELVRTFLIRANVQINDRNSNPIANGHKAD